MKEIIDVTSGHIKLDELLRAETTKSGKLSIHIRIQFRYSDAIKHFGTGLHLY